MLLIKLLSLDDTLEFVDGIDGKYTLSRFPTSQIGSSAFFSRLAPW